MYEMEGPRLAPGPWPPDFSRAERLAATTSVRFWLSAPVARPFPRRPRFPWDLNPSSVVRNFYCLPPPLHKAFPPSLQDSFVVHRTSAVYPLCTVPFHWPMHRSVHNLCGQTASACAASTALRKLAARSEAQQKLSGEAKGNQLADNRGTDHVARLTIGEQRAPAGRCSSARRRCRTRPGGPSRRQGPQQGQDPNHDRSCRANQRAGSRRGGLHPAGIDTCGDRVCPELVVRVRPVRIRLDISQVEH
jgi:hypothetical protein